MQSNEADHIVGRRLDVNGGNVISFRSAEPRLNYGLSKRNSDHDMLEYVRAQEQKMKLEKLKWQENDAKVAAIHKRPAAPPIAVKTMQSSAASAAKAKPTVLKSKPAEVLVPKPEIKTKPSPQHIAEVIETRNKRATDWLHKEQQEYRAKKAEILEHKRAAKELDRKRREQEHQEAERRRQKQLQMLQGDPMVAEALPAELGPVLMSATVTSAAPAPSAEPVLPTADPRMSYNTLVIHQVAAQLQLPTHPENELHLMHKRPGVPRLSKGYVSKAHLLSGVSDGAVVSEPAAAPAPAPAAAAPQAKHSGKAVDETPLLVPRKARVTPKDAASDDSDGYGDDDFETDGQDNAGNGVDTSLVRRLIERTQPLTRSHRAEHKPKGAGAADSDGSDGEGTVEGDPLTAQEKAEANKRREEGRKFAEQRRAALAKQTAEQRRQKALEEEKRKQALAQLQSEVVTINKRTKHSTASVSSATRSNNTSSTGQPPQPTLNTAALRAMLSGADGAADSGGLPYDEVPVGVPEAGPRAESRASDNPSLDVQLPRSSVGHAAAAVMSPARYATSQEDDLRDLDPADAGGWNQFLQQERSRAQQLAQAESSPPRRRGDTPPRGASAQDGPSPASQGRSRSPPLQRNSRGKDATGGQDGRRPTPPPFRFNSWQPARPLERASASMRAPATTIVAVKPPIASSTRRPHTAHAQATSKVTAPKNARSSASLRQRRKAPMDHERRSAAHPAHRGRSVSAGSTGLSRRHMHSGEPDDRPPSRARSAGRSRSVFQVDDFDQDALHLLDRQYAHSSDDEVQLGDMEPEPTGRPAAPPSSYAASSHHGLGGYLSKSPARSFLHHNEEAEPQFLYGPSPHTAAVLDEVAHARHREDARSREEQRLMQDVHTQAFRNFEQVTRVLQDVDRWCERAKQETLQLKEKLRMRESTEFTHGDVPRHGPVEMARVHRQDRPHGAGELSPPDEKDIADIRNSLAGRLSSRAEELFSESSSEGSPDESTHSAGISASAAAADGADTAEQQASKVEEWRRHNAAVRARHSVSLPPTAVEKSARAAEAPAFDGVVERKQSQPEETEDSVLMGESDAEAAAPSAMSDESDSDEDPYLAKLKERFEGIPRTAPPPPATGNQPGFVQLNTGDADRPMLWTAGTRLSAEDLATRDPLLAHQLGMAADKAEILARYSKLDMSTSTEAPRKSPGAGPGSPNRYRHSEDDRHHDSDVDDWTKPFPATLPPKASTSTSAQSKYMPSLRNVGELAGLLRKQYAADLSTEEGRAAMLAESDSDASDDDSSSEMGGNYDNYSAVSIMAARLMAQQTQALREKQRELEDRAGSSAGEPAVVAPMAEPSVAPEVSVSRASTSSSTGRIPDPDPEEEKFWADMLVKPERQLPDDSDLDAGPAMEELLSDYVMNLKYGTGPAGEFVANPLGAPAATAAASAHGVDASSQSDGAAPPKIRFSGAEMRMRMLEELRKQDELFNYTLELAELEKTHAMQEARDLAMRAHQRSAEELAALQQRQELEMQRLAYENSLALSMVSAQGAMEKQSAEQREQLLQLQSRISAQELFRQYQDLLHQANEVAGSLEQNQKLLEVEKLLQEERARDVVANLESKHAAEKAALMLAHAEVQKSHAEALVEASRTSMELLAQQQRSISDWQQVREGAPPRGPEVRQTAFAAAPARSRQDSYGDDFDEYSEQFETEASISMLSKPRTSVAAASTSAGQRAAVRRADSEDESIPEDDDGGAATPRGADHSLEVSDSIAYSPMSAQKAAQVRTARAAQESHDSSRLSVSTASPAVPNWRQQAQAQRYQQHSDGSDADEVEDDVDQSAAAAAEESEQSVFESYADSPQPAPRSKVQQSYSQSSRAFEVSEASSRPPQQPVRMAPQHRQADDSAESIPDEASAAAEVPSESAEGEASYSDTFEASDSKGSKGASTISSASAARPTISAREPVQVSRAPAPVPAPAAVSATLNTRTPRSSIPALESSHDSSAELGDSAISQMLDQYRADMEERLRGQEKTYRLKVQFLKAKQAQRMEWLQQVKQNAKISAADLAEEEQRIQDSYAEERAEVERERWALNARAYKELRKFKHLRRDLLKYQANVRNSAQAAAELEANLLALKNRRSVDDETFGAHRKSRRHRDAFESSEATSTSADSAPVARRTKPSISKPPAAAAGVQETVTGPKASAVLTAASAGPAAATRKAASPASSADFEVEEDYAADDFEVTYSTAASPQKAPASTQPAVVDASTASYSESFEHSQLAADKATRVSPQRDRTASEPSEVPDEDSIAEEMNDSGMESEPEQSNLETSAAKVDAPAATAALAASAADETGASYDEEFEQTGEASATAPAQAQQDPVPKREEREEDYSSYDDDFAQESDVASEGRPGLSTPAAPVAQAHTAAAAVQYSPVKKEDEVEEVADEDIESEISAYGQESDGSDEPYYLSASVVKAEGSLIAPLTATPTSAAAAHTQSPQDAEEPAAEEAPQGVSQREAPSPGAAEQLDASTYSAGSAAAAREEDADEVQYEEDDFAEYESEPEVASPTTAPKIPDSASPVPTRPTPASPGSFEEDQVSVAESIATSIVEDEDLAASAQLAQSQDSGSEDYLTASKAELSLQQPAEEGGDGAVAVEIPSPSEVSPQKVASTESAASTQLSIQSTSPMHAAPAPAPAAAAAGAAEGDDERSLDPNVEFWGSEDFVESPAVFMRKTSELLMQQNSGDGYLSGGVANEDSPNKMRFDPDQQCWVGGDEVSLDGFDESVEAVGNNADLAPAATVAAVKEAQAAALASGEIADIDTSIEDSGAEDSRGSLSEHEGAVDRSASSADRRAHSSPERPRQVQGIAAKDEDDYASDEFSYDDGQPAEVDVATTMAPAATNVASPQKTADSSRVDEDVDADDEVPEELEESIASSVEQDAHERQVTARSAPANKVDASMLSVASASAGDVSASADASDLSALVRDLETSPAKPAPQRALEVSLDDQDVLDGTLTEISTDHVESAATPVALKKTPATAAVVMAEHSADDSLLADVLGMSYEDDKDASLASEATEYADLDELKTDYVELAWRHPTTVAETAQPARQAMAAAELAATSKDNTVAKQVEAKKAEEEHQLVLVEEVTDHLMDVLVENECARVLALVGASSVGAAFAAQPKSSATQSQSPEKKTSKPASASPVRVDDDDLDHAADLLAEKMMRQSGKFRHAEEERHQPESKASMSSLGGLPSLPGKKSTLPPVAGTSSAAERTTGAEGRLAPVIERPAEFGDDDEEMYDFDIPTRSGTAVAGAHSGGIVHPPHGTEEPAKDEPQAGAALIAAVVAAEAVNTRCQELITTAKDHLETIFSEQSLQLAAHLADPDFQGRFIAALPPPEEGTTVVTEVTAVHAAAMADRIQEICAEIHAVKHGPCLAGAPTQPLAKRLLLQALPLRDDAIKSHISRTVLAEQEELARVMKCATEGSEVAVSVDLIDNYRAEAEAEIRLASEQMADALLARCLIETCAELGDIVDLRALLGGQQGGNKDV